MNTDRQRRRPFITPEPRPKSSPYPVGRNRPGTDTPHKRVWDTRRAQTDIVQDVYTRAPDDDLRKHAAALDRCSKTLQEDTLINRETGEVSVTVKSWKCREALPHLPIGPTVQVQASL